MVTMHDKEKLVSFIVFRAVFWVVLPCKMLTIPYRGTKPNPFTAFGQAIFNSTCMTTSAR
jgi:hypothetical protein